MAKGLTAEASININAPVERVWEALIDPKAIQYYMFGAQVTSEWREGSSITWKGEWQGKSFEDRGKILQLVPQRLLQYSHFSPLSGMPDKPENYHTVTVEILPNETHTHVTLNQDNNATEEERIHSKQNWEMMLASLKKFLEQPRVKSAEERPEYNPALEKLSVLVGEWKVEAMWGDSTLIGHARFHWMEGGGYLIEQLDFLPSEMPPAATWIIGSDESSQNYTALYYDTRSVSRVVQMSMQEGIWKTWRNDPEFSQRITGKISQDGNTIQVNLEKSFDGVNWMHDFDIVYTRVM